jgi:hypothetical protein
MLLNKPYFFFRIQKTIFSFYFSNNHHLNVMFFRKQAHNHNLHLK